MVEVLDMLRNELKTSMQLMGMIFVVLWEISGSCSMIIKYICGCHARSTSCRFCRH